MTTCPTRIRAGYEIAIRCEQPAPLLGLLSVHPSRACDLRAAAQCGRARKPSTVRGSGELLTRISPPSATLRFSVGPSTNSWPP